MKNTEHSKRFLQLARPGLRKLFGKLSESQFAEISELVSYVHFLSDEYVFKGGDQGDSLYILLYGRVRVLKEEGEEQELIAELGKGECFGEMALITGNPRNASVVAIRDCDMIKMSKQAFDKISHSHPELGLNLARLIIERFSNKQIHHNSKGIVNLALVPIHESIDLRLFSKQLTDVLSISRKVKVVSITSVNEVLGDGLANTEREQSEQNSKLTKYLNALEDEFELIIYLSTYKPDNWSKRCTRQADEIFLIGDVAQAPTLTEMEDVLFKEQPAYFSARQTLILLRPPEQGMIKGTRHWLELRKRTKFHFHMSVNNQLDFERLSRYITDESIGLVLAGGGIKAMAHVGVYKALSEHGIPIDLVGGTSMGSVIAANIAYNFTVEQLYENVRIFKEAKPATDYNLLPFISFLKGKQMQDLLDSVFGDFEIEDTILKLYCISANLSHAQQVVHKSGHVADALQASMSLPGVWPPKISDQGLLVDGGIVNNFPVDIMHEYSVKSIIGVNFSVTEHQGVPYDKYPSGGQMLLGKINKKKRIKGVPKLFNTLMKSSLIASMLKTEEAINLCDVYINPDTSKVGLLDFKGIESAVEAGYVETVKILEKEENRAMLGIS